MTSRNDCVDALQKAKKHTLRHEGTAFACFYFVTQGFSLVLFQFLQCEPFTGFDVLALRHHFAVHQRLSDGHHFGLHRLWIKCVLETARANTGGKTNTKLVE